MKNKKFEKKLVLNKKTIITLDDINKDNVKGGLKWECSGECFHTIVQPSGCQWTAYTVCFGGC